MREIVLISYCLSYNWEHEEQVFKQNFAFYFILFSYNMDVFVLKRAWVVGF